LPQIGNLDCESTPWGECDKFNNNLPLSDTEISNSDGSDKSSCEHGTDNFEYAVGIDRGQYPWDTKVGQQV